MHQSMRNTFFTILERKITIKLNSKSSQRTFTKLKVTKNHNATWTRTFEKNVSKQNNAVSQQ